MSISLTSLNYLPSILSLDALSQLYEKHGLGTLEELNSGTLTDAQLVEKAEQISSEDKTAIAQLQGRVFGLLRTREDIELAQLRLFRNKNRELFRWLKAQGVSSDQFLSKFNKFSIGQTVTTHPLQLETDAAEELLDEYAKKYHRYMDLTKGTIAGNELGTLKHKRSQKILTEIQTLVGELTQLEKQIAPIQLYNEDKPTALSEASLKIKPMATQLDAWVANLVDFRRKAVSFYPELNTLNSKLFTHVPIERDSWLYVDGDGNLNLLPKESVEFKKKLLDFQFQRHFERLDDAIIKFTKQNNNVVVQKLNKIKEQLAQTAAHCNIEGFTINPEVSAFFDERDYEIELRKLQNNLVFGSKEANILEFAVSEAQIGGLYFSKSQPRLNANVVNLFIDALGRQQNIIGLSGEDTNFKLFFLKKAFNNAKKIDITTLNTDFLINSPAEKEELVRLIEWIKSYEDMHKTVGKKSITALIMANASDPAQVAAMRVALKSVRISTGLFGQVTVKPLLEAHQDFVHLDDRIRGLSSSMRNFIFPRGPQYMYATSDIAWVNGTIYGNHRNYAHGKRHILEYTNKLRYLSDHFYLLANFIPDKFLKFKYKAHDFFDNIFNLKVPYIYKGTGVGGQRSGLMYSFQMMMGFPDGALRTRHTLQGDIVHAENRSFRQSLANGQQFLATGMARAFGMGNDPFPERNIIVKDIADRTHRIYQATISQNGLYDIVLSELTPMPFESLLNKGSRSGTGSPQTLDKIISDITGKLGKGDLRGSTRAITKAHAVEGAGFSATHFGHGFGMRDWINEAHKGNVADGIAALQERFRNNLGYRWFVIGAKRALHTSDIGILRAAHTEKLLQHPELNSLIETIGEDLKLQKHYLWQIDPRPITRNNLGALRVARALLLTQLKNVPLPALSGHMLHNIANNVKILTHKGRSVKALLDLMASTSRIFRNGG